MRLHSPGAIANAQLPSSFSEPFFPPKTLITVLSPPLLIILHLCTASTFRERERKMKSTSKVIMGATLIMVLTLAIVLALVLVLLAELYCSLLVRRRQLSRPTTAPADSDMAVTPTQSQNQLSSAPPPPLLGRFYSHGVLNAPRSFLFPSLSSKEDGHAQLHHILNSSQPQPSSATTSAAPAVQVRISSSSPPSPSPATESQLQEDKNAATGSSKEYEHLVYISNPIFDDCSRYATPDTSPSRLGSSSDEEDDAKVLTQCPFPIPITPPLSPMKDLPAEACSVWLKVKDAGCTSESDSHSIINGGGSTSSSATPSTSPSW